MKLTISPRKVAGVLLLGVLLLFCASIAVQAFLEAGWGGKTLRQTLRLFLATFSVDENDASVSAWYSSFALLLSSALLAVIAVAKKQRGERYGLHWGALSFVFLLLSMDEVAMIHEAVGKASTNLVASLGFTPTGFLYYFWVVPGAAFVFVVLLAYLRFLCHLPRRTLFLFLVAGTLFVGSAIGIEMLEARLTYAYEGGAEGAKGALSVVWLAEEVLEMLGVVVFVYALLSYMGSFAKELTVRIGAEDE